MKRTVGINGLYVSTDREDICWDCLIDLAHMLDDCLTSIPEETPVKEEKKDA